MEDILNYIKIDEKISTSGQPTKHQLEKIKDEGFDVVINLATSASSNVLKDEDKIVTDLGLAYFHIPVDFENPTTEDASLFLHTLVSLQNRKVWVHCAKNYRVTAFMYLYHKHILNTPFDDINLSMFEEWAPDESWQNIMKSSFEELDLT